MKQRIAAVATWFAGSSFVGLAMLVGLSGCDKQAPPSGCERAVANLVAKVDLEWKKEEGRSPTDEEAIATKGNAKKTVQTCVAEKWSPEAVRCFQEGKDIDALTACFAMLSEQQRNKYFLAIGLTPGATKPELAKVEVKKLVHEAFPLWAAAHPDKACPAGIEDLIEYVPFKGQDPWGNRYRVICGDKLPAGATGLAAVSDGPDGKPDTADDVRSW